MEQKRKQRENAMRKDKNEWGDRMDRERREFKTKDGESEIQKKKKIK